MNSIFLHYFGLSLSMSIVIAVLLALNRLFGSKFKAKCRYLVWIIITGRLLVPAFFLIPTALFNINFNLTATNRPFSSSSPQNDAYTAPAHIEPEKNNRNSLNFESDIHSSEFVETQSNLNEDLSPATSPSNQVNRDDYYPVYYPSGFEPTETYANDEDIISDSRSDLSNDKESSDIIRILSTAWLAGAVVYVSVILAAHAKFTVTIRKNSEVPAPGGEVYDAYVELCKTFKIRRPPDLLVWNFPNSPMLAGIFKPKLIIPELNLSDEATQGIISHELIHYKRRDLLVKLLSVFSCALHWFNPLAHTVSSRLSAECELSCDELALDGKSEEYRINYGYRALSIIKSCKRPTSKLNGLYDGFNPKKTQIKERFMNILDSEKKKNGKAIVSVVLLICIASGILFSCDGERDGAAESNNNEKNTARVDISETDDSEQAGVIVKSGDPILSGDYYEAYGTVSGGYNFYVYDSGGNELFSGESHETIPKFVKICDGLMAVRYEVYNGKRYVSAHRYFDSSRGLASDEITNLAYFKDGIIARVTEEEEYGDQRLELRDVFDPSIYSDSESININDNQISEPFRVDSLSEISFSVYDSENYNTTVSIKYQGAGEQGIKQSVKLNIPYREGYRAEEAYFSNSENAFNPPPSIEPFHGDDPSGDTEARHEWLLSHGLDQELSGLNPDLFKSLAADNNLECIDSFLTGDVETLRSLTGATKAAYSCYNGMSINDYTLSVERIYNNGKKDRVSDSLILTVNIGSSNVPELPAGEHKLIIFNGLFMSYDKLTNKVSHHDLPVFTPEEYIDFTVARGGFDFESLLHGYELGDQSTVDPEYIIMRLNKIRNYYALDFSADEIKEYARKYLGITDYPIEKWRNFSDGAATLSPRCGLPIYEFDIIKSETREDHNVVTVLYWADFARTVKGREVEYHIRWNGGDYSPMFSKVIWDGGYDISHTSAAGIYYGNDNSALQ